MTRVHDYIIGQNEKFLMDAADQRIKIAPRKIGTANASCEKDIAADDYFLVVIIKSEMTWRMPRKKQYLKRSVAEFDGVTLVEKAIRRRTTIPLKAVVGRVNFYRPQNGFVVRMNPQFDFVFLLNVIISQNVIDVTMGIEKGMDFQFAGGNKVIQRGAFLREVTARIDDHRFVGFIKGNNRVFLKGVENESLNR